jgi:hypothetical protein
MKTLTIRLSDSELAALRSHAVANRMSMAQVIMQSLDSHIAGFRAHNPRAASVDSTAKDIQVDMSDLNFDED